MPDIFKLGFKLFVITVVAAFALSITNMFTEQPILDQIKAANEIAQKDVLANAEHFDSIYSYDDDISTNESEEYPMVLEVHKAYNESRISGYTLKIANMAYGGELILIVGINVDGTVEGIRIMQHKETPGLGANAQKPKFYDQYVDKTAQTHIDSDEVSVISGATITTNAVTASVNAAIDYYNSELVAGGGNQ
ncbi:MAG TPA: FMN-binding protein [Bacillota bacterium]|nr:FMN-binding protein [Bacillota bacterium]